MMVKVMAQKKIDKIYHHWRLFGWDRSLLVLLREIFVNCCFSWTLDRLLYQTFLSSHLIQRIVFQSWYWVWIGSKFSFELLMLVKLDIQSHGCCCCAAPVSILSNFSLSYIIITIVTHNIMLVASPFTNINIEIFSYLQIVWEISWCHVWSNCQTWLCCLTPALILCDSVWLRQRYPMQGWPHCQH